MYDVVTRVEYAGVEDVYDLTTANHHNFVGNGVVLHNCLRTLHAEENAIAFATRTGKSLMGCRAYLTARPCQKCTKLMVQAGITQILYWMPYNTDALEDQVEEMLQRAGVHLLGPMYNSGLEMQVFPVYNSETE
jgi:deoxycytidylate deaminase